MLKKYDKILYDTLLEKEELTARQLSPIIKKLEQEGGSFQRLIVDKGLLAEKRVLELLAEKLKLGCYDLKRYPVDPAVLKKIPLKVASYYKFIPLKIAGRVLTIAVSSPLDIKTQDEIRTQVGYDIETVLSCADDIAESIKKHYGLAADTLEGIVSQQAGKPGSSSLETAHEKVDDIEKLAEDASVIKLVNQIILEGWQKRATDIHIEPYRGKIALRYRIDGILYDATVPPGISNFLNAIISRIKIMSNLNIVERRVPQDGRAVVKVQNQVLDLRISTVPTPFGESVVIRILPTERLIDMEKLGLSGRDLHTLEELIDKPHGIVFATGPTGSGKTTTLYACLNKINTKERKIITIEDPIEYEMSGIIQMQVMSDIGLDFARGLRSILRHDPDVIMVGEVRDLETAEIAIRVALTGHLIFSTLHTNDAASGITRLVDIGLEPYLVASSVEAFIAQRLIRILCPKCKVEDREVPAELRTLIARDLKLNSSKFKVYKGKGCHECNFTGFYGRTAVYETLLVTEKIKDLIVRKMPSSHIKRLAMANGMRTLRQDGWQKVLEGVTTPQEVMQVTSAEEEADELQEREASSRELPLSVGLKAQKAPGGAEQRVFDRIEKKLNMRFNVYHLKEELLEGGPSAERFTVTKNLSASGLLFVSNTPIPAGSILELKLELPDVQAPIQCLSRVVRVAETVTDKSYDIAVYFLDITSACRARLKKYIALQQK
jgi:type II secretory ATPase GspE/PulE/Tfp pilus assembly ATPase PilB-like protein